jgi:hypothetical protein
MPEKERGPSVVTAEESRDADTFGDVIGIKAIESKPKLQASAPSWWRLRANGTEEISGRYRHFRKPSAIQIARVLRAFAPLTDGGEGGDS